MCGEGSPAGGVRGDLHIVGGGAGEVSRERQTDIGLHSGCVLVRGGREGGLQGVGIYVGVDASGYIEK